MALPTGRTLSDCVRLSRIISCVAALFMGSAALADSPPRRVVSLNLCTDQLALLLADPGQVISVSKLAQDPRSAAMAQAAQDLPTNTGAAEEIVLLEPDLVLAGTFTTQATVQMLTRLGYRVELFAPINSFDEARANILRMGELLGHPARAAQVVAAFDARLAHLRETPGPRPRVALYYALGNTAGPDSLPGALLDAAGMENIATKLGVGFYGALPLESLLLADPDLVLVGRPYGGHAQATALLQHPALRNSGKLRVLDDGANWVCELPQLLDAVADLQRLRQDWGQGQ